MMVNMESYDANKLTGAQIRAGRALLNISSQELAERTGLGLATIRRAEAHDGPTKLTLVNASQITRTLEQAGVELLGAEAGKGGGVRFSKP